MIKWYKKKERSKLRKIYYFQRRNSSTNIEIIDYGPLIMSATFRKTNFYKANLKAIQCPSRLTPKVAPELPPLLPVSALHVLPLCSGNQEPFSVITIWANSQWMGRPTPGPVSTQTAVNTAAPQRPCSGQCQPNGEAVAQA